MYETYCDKLFTTSSLLFFPGAAAMLEVHIAFRLIATPLLLNFQRRSDNIATAFSQLVIQFIPVTIRY